MKLFLTLGLCAVVCFQVAAQDMDKELSDLAAKLATLTKENGKKRVTVSDFTDLQGGVSELGKYIAEELTVNMVMVKTNFSVLDRANLKKILAEHKLNTTGLIDPETAKKLGQFAGVDAIICGKIVPKGSNSVTLTTTLITTDTAEIFGAAKATFKSDDAVRQLIGKPAAPTGADASQEKAKVSKSFGTFCVDVQSLKVVNATDYVLSFSVSNLTSKTIYVTMETDDNWIASGVTKSTLSDPDGVEYYVRDDAVAGMTVGAPGRTGWRGETKRIQPKEAIPATMRFTRERRREARDGNCRVYLALLSMTLDSSGKIVSLNKHSIMSDIKTDEPKEKSSE